MTWKQFAGLGPAPKQHTTPVIDTAFLIAALKAAGPISPAAFRRAGKTRALLAYLGIDLEGE